ncbi:hypothetical protein ACFLTD_05045, partial [Elusimicrobiota bacterium]
MLKRNRLSLLALIFIVFAAYINTLSNQFVSDDIKYIQKSSIIQEFAFNKTSLQKIFLPAKNDIGTQLAGYIPLTTMTLGIDSMIYGLSPAGFHLTNIFIYILCIVSAYFFCMHISSQQSV